MRGGIRARREVTGSPTQNFAANDVREQRFVVEMPHTKHRCYKKGGVISRLTKSGSETERLDSDEEAGDELVVDDRGQAESSPASVRTTKMRALRASAVSRDVP